jgi:hypothetical protein
MSVEVPSNDDGAPADNVNRRSETTTGIWAELIRIIPPSIAALGTAAAAIIAVRH